MRMISAIYQGSTQQVRRRLFAASRLADPLDELEPGGQHVERASVFVVGVGLVEHVPEPGRRLLAHPHRLEAVREPAGQVVVLRDARPAAVDRGTDWWRRRGEG